MQLQLPMSAPPQQAMSPQPGPGAGPPPYAITPDEHVKYHSLFAQYDGDKDGYVTGLEAKTIFSKSGLSQDVLKMVWVLADDDKDNRLSPKVQPNLLLPIMISFLSSLVFCTLLIMYFCILFTTLLFVVNAEINVTWFT